MIEINKNPGRGELKWFGLLLLAFFGLVGLACWVNGVPLRACVIIWLAAAGVTAAYYAVPPLRRPMYVGWLYAAWPIGWVVSHLLLGVIFYLVITPIGLMMRLFGRDPMQRQLRPEADSYWIAVEDEPKPSDYFRQF